MSFRHAFAFSVVLALALSSVGRGAIIINGGFESSATSLSPWTTSTGVTVSSNNSHAGSNNAFFSQTLTPRTLSQTLDTNPGATYSVEYWILGGNNLFEVRWDGVVVDTVTSFSQSYTLHTINNLVAGASPVQLSFSYTGGSFFLRLDDVNVTETASPPAIPEPASLTLWGVGAVCCTIGACRRRRAA